LFHGVLHLHLRLHLHLDVLLLQMLLHMLMRLLKLQLLHLLKMLMLHVRLELLLHVRLELLLSHSHCHSLLLLRVMALMSLEAWPRHVTLRQTPVYRLRLLRFLLRKSRMLVALLRLSTVGSFATP
jgi:hypothetical protein